MYNGKLEALLERVLACIDTDIEGVAVFQEEDEVIDDLLLDIREALYGDEEIEDSLEDSPVAAKGGSVW